MLLELFFNFYDSAICAIYIKTTTYISFTHI